ncbi:MAG: hypothetical protein RL235_425 [Chlamydiota bacterium]|jgi:hypothetical protein
MEKSAPHLTLAKQYWRAHLKPGDIAIDATCGNGHDTLYLSQLILSDPSSAVFAFDIQPEAILSAETLLKKHLSPDHFRRVLLNRRTHLELNAVPLPYSPRLIVYNLGYLPGGNKQVTTKTDTTLESIKLSLELLADDGAISVMCYPGHGEGAKEEKALVDMASHMSSQDWTVCHHKWINRPNSPTFLWLAKAS